MSFPGLIVPQTKISFNGNCTSLTSVSKSHDQVVCTFNADNDTSGNIQISPSLMQGALCNVTVTSETVVSSPAPNTFTIAISNTGSAIALQNAIIRGVAVNAPSGTINSNPYGGYTEWDVADCATIKISGSKITFQWDTSGTTDTLPWKVDVSSNANIAAINVDIRF